MSHHSFDRMCPLCLVSSCMNTRVICSEETRSIAECDTCQQSIIPPIPPGFGTTPNIAVSAPVHKLDAFTVIGTQCGMTVIDFEKGPLDGKQKGKGIL